MISTLAQFALAVLVLVALGYLARNKALFESQRETIISLTSQVNALEGEVKLQKQRITTQDADLAELKATLKGRDMALNQLVEAIASAGVCANAPACPTRKMPRLPTRDA
jgi:hypothetical protein